MCGGWDELLTCLYRLKVQACPPREQIPNIRSSVSGQERRVGLCDNFEFCYKTKVRLGWGEAKLEFV